jgi:hypothetical protein
VKQLNSKSQKWFSEVCQKMLQVIKTIGVSPKTTAHRTENSSQNISQMVPVGILVDPGRWG